jgi:hypothetical protein
LHLLLYGVHSPTDKQTKKSSFKRRAVKKRKKHLTRKEKKVRNNIKVRNGSFNYGADI